MVVHWKSIINGILVLLVWIERGNIQSYIWIDYVISVASVVVVIYEIDMLENCVDRQ
jgi:hypothetical protein